MISIGTDINRIKPEFYEQSPSNQLFVEEAQQDGKAKLTVTLPAVKDRRYYKLEQENTHWLQYAKNAKCADGVVVGIDSNNGLNTKFCS